LLLQQRLSLPRRQRGQLSVFLGLRSELAILLCLPFLALLVDEHDLLNLLFLLPIRLCREAGLQFVLGRGSRRDFWSTIACNASRGR